MNIFDNLQGAILMEGSKVIGVKDEDKMRLIAAQEAKSSSSSFSAPQVEEIPVQEQTVIVETPSEEVINDVVSSIESEQLGSVSVPETPQSVSIFDQTIPSYEQTSTVQAPQMETVTPLVEPVPVVENPTPVFESASILSEVPLPKDETNNTLDTPQTFFDRTEKSTENNLDAQSYESTDPALILIGNLKEVVESKNRMIQILTDKVNALENQLSMSEEARKVLEAQKNAAESTLQAARNAETGGPSLVYQQQNYQQAA